MKKKVLSGLFAITLLVATGYGVSQNLKSNTDLTFLALTNVEALADGESGSGGTCYNSITTKEASRVFYCGTCSWVDGTNSWFSGKSTC